MTFFPPLLRKLHLIPSKSKPCFLLEKGREGGGDKQPWFHSVQVFIFKNPEVEMSACDFMSPLKNLFCAFCSEQKSGVKSSFLGRGLDAVVRTPLAVVISNTRNLLLVYSLGGSK